MIPRTTATMAEVLRDNGYTTWWYGKNHNTPDWETSVAGPFDRWPTGMGFDYFYGFNAGEAHQYYPVIFENTTPVEPDKSPKQGYHLLTDMTDRAIARMQYEKSVSPGKPFFMYFAPGAMHAPHHVTKQWRDKFKGKFDMGWEKYREIVFENQKRMGIVPPNTKLTPRPDWVPAWSSLSDKQKKVYNALFENYAGYFAFADHEVGRLLDAIKKMPGADNTLIIYIVGDNGASSEGGPDGTLDEIKNLSGMNASVDEILKDLDKLGGPQTEPHYPVGWAWAGNTPFQWVKQVASHLGGSRNPMVISWPAKIRHDDKPRDAFLHLVDIAPTVYEAAHVTMPQYVNGIEQLPLAGASFLASFTDPAFQGRKDQYFEILSNRSIYADGWKANAQHTLPWRQDLAPGNWDQDKWELYNLNEDYSEANNLATQMPDKLEEMKKKFDAAAEKYHVYPLDDRGVARILEPKPPPPGSNPEATEFTYYAGATRLPETASPAIKNRSWTITADVHTNGSKTNGVILAAGGVSSGITLYLKNGIPIFDYNYYGKHTIVKAPNAIAAGAGKIELDFNYAGGGMGKAADLVLKVNGQPVGKGKMAATIFGRFGVDTFGVGEDSGQPVTTDYQPPFRFNGTIDKVVIRLK
ncbi:sulfatase-like hydrolase/transferase [Chitinophaga barathri]|uniref:sulfatase-like hydrolase/transferase n=1 Tax=Chitinophaga barathri TaxID=1647451 RepID=UPI0019D45235|nr:sulfatase-like hydrolase/transferase [Chitinophaga barathri]